MTTTEIIRKEVNVKASLARVWTALTSAEAIKEYLYGTTVITEWKEGGSIRFTGTWDGVPYEDKGTILTYRANQVLEYTYWSSFSGIEDVPSNYAIVKFELKAEGDQTTLVLTQRNSPTAQMQENSEKGWEDVLQKLVHVIEKAV